MIFGSCPYCDHGMVFHIGDQRTPYWGHETCEACGKTFWENYSRFDPQSMTEEEFAKEHSVDWENRTITQNPSPIGIPVKSDLKDGLTRVPTDRDRLKKMQDDLDAIADKIIHESSTRPNEGGQ